MSDIGYEVRTFDCSGDGERRPVGFGKDLPYEMCLIRHGCFRFRNTHGTVLVDPTTALLGRADDFDYEIEHPLPGGDGDTFVLLDAETVAAVAGGDVDLPAFVHLTPTVELAHRRLIAAHAQSPQGFSEEEFAVDLLAWTLAAANPLRVSAGWSTARRRAQRLVDDARMILVADPDRSLVDLAAALGCSPHHLSRLFRRHTGLGVAAYRMSLRVQQALDGLVDGAPSLSDLAAASGFFDHAHLTRSIVDRFGVSPTALRSILAPRP